MEGYLVDLTLLEPVFFASREISNYYETEPVIGNYALCYALGWTRAAYRVQGGPTYRQDLMPLREQGIYVSPGTPVDDVAYSMASFNALTDAYWYQMAKNAIEVAKGQRTRAVNYPQNGRIKQLGTGSRFRFAVISSKPVAEMERPVYVRLGKWMSRTKLSWQRARITSRQEDEAQIPLYLNGADVLDPSGIRRFDLTVIYPAPILRNVQYSGAVYELKPDRGVSVLFPTCCVLGGQQWSGSP